MLFRSIDGLSCWSYLGLDAWMPYLESIKSKQNVIQFDLEKDSLERFPDKSYDVVICLDVLEHLSLERVAYVLDNMKRIARKTVIIFTPSTFKDNHSATENAWDLGPCPFQKHKCLVPYDLLESKGFRVRMDNADNAYFGVFKWE